MQYTYPVNNGYGRTPQPTPQPMFVGLKGRPVSSLEEARATGIDFDGSIFYFPDLAHKRIYTKQINQDGSATLVLYEAKEIPPEVPAGSYITRQEFEEAISQLRAAIPQPKEQIPIKF